MSRSNEELNDKSDDKIIRHNQVARSMLNAISAGSSTAINAMQFATLFGLCHSFCISL